ncbi:MAG: hypothetical protein AABX39_01305 [Nanoarchaeota archaeon]
MNRKTNLLFLLVVVGLILIVGCEKNIDKSTKPQTQQDNEPLNVSLGEEFTLYLNQSVRVENEEYGIRIMRFFKCPLLVGECVDPHGITIEHKKENNDRTVIGTIKKVPESMDAFGYKTTVIDSDMKIYAKLKVEKIQNKYQDVDLTPVYGCVENSDCVIDRGICGTTVYNKNWNWSTVPEYLKDWAKDQMEKINGIMCEVGKYARNPRCENSTCTGDYTTG